jgi:L-rhamnonate dehydratase
MRITEVEAIHLRLPQVEEIADGTQDVLVIRIHTDSGLIGIGEVTSQSYVCKAIFEAPRSAERRHGLTYLLRGQAPMDVEGLWRRMYYH